MWDEIINIVISNGIFAILFVMLLSYLLKDSSKREKKYTDTIASLCKNIQFIDNLDKETKQIKVKVEEVDKKVTENSTLIKKVGKDVRGVRKEVTEMKKIIFPSQRKVSDEEEI